jgi:ATP-dependent Lon protease
MHSKIPSSPWEGAVDETDPAATPASLLVPVLPLKDVSLFPGASLALVVSRPHAISAIRTAERCEVPLLALAQRDSTTADPGPQGLHDVGTLATVREALAVSPMEIRLEVDGFSRARVRELVGTRLQVAEAEPLAEEDEGDEAGPAIEALARYLHAHPDLRAFLDEQRRSGDSMSWVNLACQHLPITSTARQKLLEASPVERCTMISRGLDALLRKEGGL